MEASATGSLITVNIDGKPLEKLIEVVSNGIGTLYRPRKIRKEADAQAYAIKVLGIAKAIAGSDARLIDAETTERIGQRLVAQEIRRQNNIDSVVEAAAVEMKGKQVSDDPVSDDWTTRFFGYVQDVSEEDMQAIWAKILAREIEKPNSFSIRLLNLMSMLSRKEAEVIGNMAQFVVYSYTSQDAYILNSKKIEELKFNDIMLLMELGLLDGSSNLAITFDKNGADSINLLLTKKDTGLFVSSTQEHMFVHIYKLTSLGREIMQLVDGAELNINYVKEFAEELMKGDNTMSVLCAKITKLVDNDVELDEEHAYVKMGAKYDMTT